MRNRVAYENQLSRAIGALESVDAYLKDALDCVGNSSGQEEGIARRAIFSALEALRYERNVFMNLRENSWKISVPKRR